MLSPRGCAITASTLTDKRKSKTMLNDNPRHAPIELSSATNISYSSPALKSAVPARSWRPLAASAGMGRVGWYRPARHEATPIDPDPWRRTLAALQQFNAARGEFSHELMYSRLRARPDMARAQVPTFAVNVLAM